MRYFVLLGVLIAIIAVAVLGMRWLGPSGLRYHTATTIQPLQIVLADAEFEIGTVDIRIEGDMRIVEGNGVPSHAVGAFLRPDFPNEISAQSYRFEMPANPQKTEEKFQLSLLTNFGVGLNGVPFDPLAAEYFHGERQNWQYEALGGAVALRLDENNAHVQPTGGYHYHGLPTLLMLDLGWTENSASPLIGYAADGFPIYAITAKIDGVVTKLSSGYVLKEGNRPGGGLPDGDYDGSFTQDYEYRAGLSPLDECNGMIVRTTEYPIGTYAYFLTEEFPVVPRCLMGAYNESFRK